MREILFRGKRVDNGEWVYGFPCFIYSGGETILCITVYADKEKSATFSHTFGVNPATVGQYIGLTDKTARRFSREMQSEPGVLSELTEDYAESYISLCQ